MAWTGFAKPATPLNLNKHEEREITENFLTKPCIRCNDENHSCLNCNNSDITRSDGFFGKLSAGKKLGANKLIESLKKKYAANPGDLTFKTSQEKSAPQNEPPAKHGKKTGPSSSNQQASSADQSSISHSASNTITTLSAPNSNNSSGSGQTFGYSFHYDRREIQPNNPPRPVDNPASAPLKRNASDMDLEKLKNMTLDYPTRTTFGDRSKKSQVLTNHFQLTCDLDKPITLYEYKIPELEGKGKRKTRAMIQSIIANCPVLTTHRQSFATDFYHTIVAWTDLGQHLRAANHVETVTGTYHLLQLSDGPVSLEFMKKVDMRDLFRYAQMDPALPDVDIENLTRLFNIIISQGAEQSIVGTVSGGGGKHYRKDAHVRLGNSDHHVSLCTHRGYSYSVRAGAGAVLLNVANLTSAFWCPIRFDAMLDDNHTWDMNMAQFEGLAIGLRVYITYDRGDKEKDPEAWARLNSREGRVKKVAGIGLTAREQMFTPEGSTEPISVKDHFDANYPPGFLRNPDMFVVNLGEKHDPRWYPAEKLEILAYQKYKSLPPSHLMDAMHGVACKMPSASMALVRNEGLATLGITNFNNAFSPFPSCNLFNLRPVLLQIDANQLANPVILYGRKKSCNVGYNGRWNLRDIQLFQPKNANFRALVFHKGQVHTNAAYSMAESLRIWSRKYHVGNLTWGGPGPLALSQSGLGKDMQAAITQENAAGVNMAVMFIEAKDIAKYQNFKDLCDRKYGLHAICIVRSRQSENKDAGGFWGNVILKMNLKGAGINHTIEGGIGMEDKLVLGADVTHPGPGSIPGCPSIASIVGSVDRHAGRFLGSMRLQRKSKRETIDGVEEMVSERLYDWIEEMTPRDQKYKTLPKEIYYYRDGVSEGQYASVKSEELPAIKRAWASIVKRLEAVGKIDPKQTDHVPKLLAVICGKRHNVRFYPTSQDKAGPNQNCHPGTTVDDVVTSPYYQDFYLQSHVALQGTARSCHYFVIENEPNISLPDLRQFTHKLCYTYVRATMGVSYASPAYYADRLCERGRCYLRSYFTAPRGTEERKWFNDLKDKHEKTRKAQREQKFGTHKRGTKKSAGFVEHEAEDKDKVQKLCDDEVMKRTKEIFYSFRNEGKGGNPWHPRLSKTMFWM